MGDTKETAIEDKDKPVTKVDTSSQKEATAPLFCSARLALFLVFLMASCNMIVQRFNVNFALVCMHKSIPLADVPTLTADMSPVNFTNLTITSESPFEDQIVNASITNLHIRGENGCPTGPLKTSNISVDENSTSEFSWSKETQGSIIAAFYYGLAISQIPSAWMVDRFGSKRSLLLSQFLLSALSIINPITAKSGATFLFVVRFLQGIVNGPALPAINVLSARWSGSMERSLLVGIFAAGFSLATAIVYPICAFFCENSGWPGIFYFAGGSGLLWCLVACFTIYEWPEDHPRIGSKELRFIQKFRAVHYGGPKQEKIKTPWLSMLTSLPVWAVFIANFSCFWCFLTVGTYLPTYLNEVLQLNISENGFLSALPFVGMMCFHFFVAMLFDRLRTKELCSVTILRKIFNSIGMFSAAISLGVLGLLPCDSLFANMLFFTLSQTLQEFAWMGGYLLSIFEIGPRHTSSLTALNNTFAYLAGFVGAAMVAWMTSDGTREQWLHVFYMSAGLNVFGGIFYLIFGQSTLQTWAAGPSDKNKNGDVREVELREVQVSLINNPSNRKDTDSRRNNVS